MSVLTHEQMLRLTQIPETVRQAALDDPHLHAAIMTVVNADEPFDPGAALVEILLQLVDAKATVERAFIAFKQNCTCIPF